MTAFADTSGLYAVLDADDENHVRARDAWTHLLSRDGFALTTNYVLVETCALVQHRLGIQALQTLVNDILPTLRTERITEDDHDAALLGVLTGARRDLSLVDCASFVVMRRMGLEEAFAFDRHFSEQGFSTLPMGADPPTQASPAAEQGADAE